MKNSRYVSVSGVFVLFLFLEGKLFLFLFRRGNLVKNTLEIFQDIV